MAQDSAGPVLFYERRFYVFSNFSSFAVMYKGRLCSTSEHAYHVEKFDDLAIIDEIANARSAHDALQIAKRHKDKRRPDWDDVKVSVMYEVCRAKLEQHPYIQKLLLETGDRLIVEDSHKDGFWGWGPKGDGRNELGKIWMRLRDELRAGLVRRAA